MFGKTLVSLWYLMDSHVSKKDLKFLKHIKGLMKGPTEIVNFQAL
jgi:hypothetical protein